jgi:hypothetical protein
MIKFEIDCNEIIKDKILYTIEVCRDYFHYKISDTKEIIILYSDKEKNEKNYNILIKSDSASKTFYSGTALFSKENLKYYEYGKENIPFFFLSFYDKLYDYQHDKNKVIINVDIFSSAFYFLSLWQEYYSKERDIHNRYCGKSSLQYEINMLDKPIVTIYFNIILSILSKYFGVKVKDNEIVLALSHDIDYIKKWSVGIIYREIVQYFLLNKKEELLGKRVERLKHFLKAFFDKNDPYRNSFIKMVDYEIKNGIRSTYFLKSGITSKHDVSYSLKNKFLLKMVCKLKEKDFDIGLHPSYKAYNNEIIMKRELLKLQRAMDIDQLGVREHFLRYDVKSTPIIHSNLNFIYDSSLGYHDLEGYRTGYSFPHKLFDLKNNKALNIIEVPLIIMDSTLEYYRNLGPEKAKTVIQQMINRLKNYGGILTLLIHNTCYDDLDYKGWGILYEEIVKYSLDENIPIKSIKESFYYFIRLIEN